MIFFININEKEINRVMTGTFREFPFKIFMLCFMDHIKVKFLKVSQKRTNLQSINCRKSLELFFLNSLLEQNYLVTKFLYT